MKIATRGIDGKPNGFVLPIWNINEDPEKRPSQVYLTAVVPHSQKGPHCHRVRRGMFCCVKGNVRIVTRARNPTLGPGCPYWIYKTRSTGQDHDYAVIDVEPFIDACIYNDGDEEALVLNMPTPAWRPDAQDEWPVQDWNPA